MKRIDRCSRESSGSPLLKWLATLRRNGIANMESTRLKPEQHKAEPVADRSQKTLAPVTKETKWNPRD